MYRNTVILHLTGEKSKHKFVMLIDDMQVIPAGLTLIILRTVGNNHKCCVTKTVIIYAVSGRGESES